MTRPSWEDHYQSDRLPWDTGVPDPALVELVDQGVLPGGRALELGCGTGTNSRFLAASGWQVVAVDLAPTAIARARAGSEGHDIHFANADILAEPGADSPLQAGPFDLVFDRGCFHCFEAPADQALFARRVAGALRVGGEWVSLIGSTEGPARDFGPPRRSAREVLAAVEPVLAVVELRALAFRDLPDAAAAWLGRFRRREMPAQPSSRRG
ncbi:MAG: class I SAM-dependent methyltransferase [Alphaproteobacteria bacterium]|nr:class I SAM-dependent methyltransferase [Alphaproteobacteria bacterium]